MGRRIFCNIPPPLKLDNAYLPDHQFHPLFLLLPLFVLARVALETWPSRSMKHGGFCGLFPIHMTNNIYLRGLPSVDDIPFRNPYCFPFRFLDLLGLLVGDFGLRIARLFGYTLLLVDYYFWNNLVLYQ